MSKEYIKLVINLDLRL